MSYPYHMESDDSFDYLFKIVLIGDAGVGKTCVVQRFKSGTFLEKQHTMVTRNASDLSDNTVLCTFDVTILGKYSKSTFAVLYDVLHLRLFYSLRETTCKCFL